jgi:hypothetical protein
MKRTSILAFLIICAASSAVLAQDPGGGIVVVKFSWNKERIRPRPSLAPLASQDELVQQSRREQQLAAARSAANKPAATRLETQISNHQKATAEARQTELPRDGYKYNVTLRNDGVKTVKSIDWDYLFFDPVDQHVLARHQFTSDENIKPGKTKQVSVLYLVPPVKTVDVRLLKKNEATSVTEQVVVVRILFEDGSVWQQP